MTDQGDIMTSAHLRKLAAIAALAVGLVFASSANANAATTKHHVNTRTVHPVHVAHTPNGGNTSNDWWV